MVHLLNDIGWGFVLPVVCLLSMISNITNVIVLKTMEKMHNIYRYMLLKSIINTLYLFLCSFTFLTKCESFCFLPKSTYIIQLYDLFIFNYFTSSLGLLDLLIEVVISVNRMFIISNSRYCQRINMNLVFMSLVGFSLLFYTPYLYVLEIKKKPGIANHSNFSTNSTETSFFLKNQKEKYQMAVFDQRVVKTFQNMLTSSIFVRGFLLSALVIIMNFASCYYYRNRLKIKGEMKNFNTSNYKYIFLFSIQFTNSKNGLIFFF